jgi:hypothetical protein
MSTDFSNLIRFIGAIECEWEDVYTILVSAISPAMMHRLTHRLLHWASRFGETRLR